MKLNRPRGGLDAGQIYRHQNLVGLIRIDFVKELTCKIFQQKFCFYLVFNFDCRKILSEKMLKLN